MLETLCIFVVDVVFASFANVTCIFVVAVVFASFANVTCIFVVAIVFASFANITFYHNPQSPFFSQQNSFVYNLQMVDLY